MRRQVRITLDENGRIAEVDLTMTPEECARGEGDAFLRRMHQFLSEHGIDLAFDQIEAKSPAAVRAERHAPRAQPSHSVQGVEREEHT